MSFKASKSTDALTIVGPRDTEFTQSELDSIPPTSLKRGWVRPGELDARKVPSSRRNERLTPVPSPSRPRP